MAQKVHIILEDDLDGSEASQTLSFGIDGKFYEIDLNDANAAKLRDSIAPFVAAGRSAAGPARRGRGRTTVTNLGPSAREIRDWARGNGYDVPDRGRIPADVRTAFEER